jgi:hypothetical protein
MKNMILTSKNDFSMEKLAQIRQIEKKKNSDC